MKPKKVHQLLFNYDEKDLLVINFIQDKYEIKTQTGAIRKALDMVSELDQVKKELEISRALASWAKKIIVLKQEMENLVPALYQPKNLVSNGH